MVNNYENEFKEVTSIDFNNFYSKNKNKLLFYINNKIKDIDISKDIMQDVFINVAENIKNFNSSRSSITTFLYNIARNKVCDYKTIKSREMIDYYSDVNSFDDVSTNSLYNFNRMNDIDDEKRIVDMKLKKSFNSLNKKSREILKLRYNYNMKYDEIANKMEIPKHTVKNRIHMSIKKMRNDILYIT